MSDFFSIPSSYKDPSGFLFLRDGILYRQINAAYKEDYDFALDSGLLKALIGAGLLIDHKEASLQYAASPDAYKVIKPYFIPFVSYPYEWCFSELKDVALLTLEIQKRALGHGMTLKDASAYNVQFIGSKPVFIDTLSFSRYRGGLPWIAYKQFCEHFLAPLALMSYTDIRLNQLSKIFLDGIPLDLAIRLLPFRARFNFSLFLHLYLHASSQRRFAGKALPKSRFSSGMNSSSLKGLIESLESAIKKLTLKNKRTEWSHYYGETNYSEEALARKKELVSAFLDDMHPKTVWDFGANTGFFSRVASNKDIQTVAFDIDPVAVEKNYLESKKKRETNILPLILDLTNPSPSIGWQNKERSSLIERGPVDTVLSLALIHHLAIGNNLPFGMIADFLHTICRSLIIEFVPKSDSQVKRLLVSREDIFPDYNKESFEREFSKYFTIRNSAKIYDSERTLYLMERRDI